MSILRAEDVSYSYQSKYQTVEAVKKVSCDFEAGKLYAVIGHSGSGKTTFLSLLAGLDLPTKGEIYIENNPVTKTDRDKYRRETASVVYQNFNLFPLLTAEENVMYPLRMNKVSKREARKEAHELLEEVGLPERIRKQLPTMMSGGEQQRVAIARALANRGKILLCDEPTGNLDTENTEVVVSLLKNLAHERGYCVIIITHDMEVADAADIVFRMQDGRMSLDESYNSSDLEVQT